MTLEPLAKYVPPMYERKRIPKKCACGKILPGNPALLLRSNNASEGGGVRPNVRLTLLYRSTLSGRLFNDFPRARPKKRGNPAVVCSHYSFIIHKIKFNKKKTCT